MRLIYQSFGVSRGSRDGAYGRVLKRIVEAAASPGVTVEIRGLSPHRAIADQYRYLEFQDAVEVLERGLEAEREGFDAFLIGNIFEPGLHEMRELLNIPVLGLRESSVHVACLMGSSFSLVNVNPKFRHRIVEGVRPWAEHIVTCELDTMVRTHGCLDYVTIFYGEMYGGSLPEAKRYTGTKAVGFRLFDAVIYKPEELKELLSKSVEDIAAMREHLVYQKFLHEGALQRLAAAYRLDVTPRLTVIGSPPETHFGALTGLMSAFPNHTGVLPPTNVALDGTPGGAEGIVLRTPDRKFICKIRFEDYERTLRAGYQAQRASGR